MKKSTQKPPTVRGGTLEMGPLFVDVLSPGLEIVEERLEPTGERRCSVTTPNRGGCATVANVQGDERAHPTTAVFSSI